MKINYDYLENLGILNDIEKYNNGEGHSAYEKYYSFEINRLFTNSATKNEIFKVSLYAKTFWDERSPHKAYFQLLMFAHTDTTTAEIIRFDCNIFSYDKPQSKYSRSQAPENDKESLLKKDKAQKMIDEWMEKVTPLISNRDAFFESDKDQENSKINQKDYEELHEDASILSFEEIWIKAHSNGENAQHKYLERNPEVWSNAWGCLYVSLDGEFGKWLKKHLKIKNKKEVQIDVPHYFYDAMQVYVNAFQMTLSKHGIKSRNDISFN